MYLLFYIYYQLTYYSLLLRIQGFYTKIFDMCHLNYIPQLVCFYSFCLNFHVQLHYLNVWDNKHGFELHCLLLPYVTQNVVK